MADRQLPSARLPIAHQWVVIDRRGSGVYAAGTLGEARRMWATAHGLSISTLPDQMHRSDADAETLRLCRVIRGKEADSNG